MGNKEFFSSFVVNSKVLRLEIDGIKRNKIIFKLITPGYINPHIFLLTNCFDLSQSSFIIKFNVNVIEINLLGFFFFEFKVRRSRNKKLPKYYVESGNIEE